MTWSSVKGHFNSLTDSKCPVLNVIFQIGAPIITVAISFCLKFPMAFRTEMLTAVSIITGLLFSLIVFLIQLRFHVRIGIENTHRDDLQKDNLDYAFSTAIYAISLGLTIVILTLLQEVTRQPFVDCKWIILILNTLIFGVFAHFVATIFIVLKRLGRVYDFYGRNK